ncbi:MAG: fructose-bisphosphate aldolase [Elusimicrobia bacterium RIFOXYC2_FULL_34_12]|nr:MAG: fructose-bisphosphate aldolase [Elusimicrobia bacterium RIFOXYC2_FULL_34_12]OGS39167.1 MAG: fructose-bisphosphate aldolase [Elusimicrobia bacterium RIFOXYD2_FULL_34_30]HAM38033.1 class II aldolase family protein [Elusimicrobiota bacterium]
MNIKKELVRIGKELADKGFVVGPGGNTSVRVDNTVYMKVSGACFEDTKESDYIAVNLKTGKNINDNRKPTCEIQMHLACYYTRKDISAVIHTHPPYSIAYAMQGKTLKAFTPDFVGIISSNVPTIKFAVPSSKNIANKVSEVIKNHNAILMANHGLLTVGSNLKEAYYRTLYVESACKTVVASKILGKMNFFSEKIYMQMDTLEAEVYRRKLIKSS